MRYGYETAGRVLASLGSPCFFGGWAPASGLDGVVGLNLAYSVYFVRVCYASYALHSCVFFLWLEGQFHIEYRLLDFKIGGSHRRDDFSPPGERFGHRESYRFARAVYRRTHVA